MVTSNSLQNSSGIAMTLMIMMELTLTDRE